MDQKDQKAKAMETIVPENKKMTLKKLVLTIN